MLMIMKNKENKQKIKIFESLYNAISTENNDKYCIVKSILVNIIYHSPLILVNLLVNH